MVGFASKNAQSGREGRIVRNLRPIWADWLASMIRRQRCCASQGVRHPKATAFAMYRSADATAANTIIRSEWQRAIVEGGACVLSAALSSLIVAFWKAGNVQWGIVYRF